MSDTNRPKKGESRATSRPSRTKMLRNRYLVAKERPGFKRRWVNEEPGRVEFLMELGWTPVVGDEDASDARAQMEGQMSSVVRRVVNRGTTAVAHTAILMEIPEDLFNEYEADKEAELQELEAGLDPEKVQQFEASYGSFKKD